GLPGRYAVLLARRVQHGKCYSCVLCLVLTHEWHPYLKAVRREETRVMVGNSNAFFAQRLPCVDDFRGARISGSLHEFTGGLVRCRANDGGHAGLEDSALLARNRRERFTKVLNVIYVYAHYASRERLNHVGTVQQAAKAHLHHGNIHLLTREAKKSEG